MTISRFIVYGLIDPRTGELRYVGKSCSGLERPRGHAAPSHLQKKTYTASWIKGLPDRRYEIEVLEEHERAQDLPEAERFWIAYFRSLGCRLTNLTAGGEGTTGFRHSDKTRAKIAAAHRGQPGRPWVPSADTRRRMGARKVGVPCDMSTKVKIVKAKGGRPFVDQHGARYLSIQGAAKKLGLSAGNIHAALHGTRTHVNGYHFSYVEAG